MNTELLAKYLDNRDSLSAEELNDMISCLQGDAKVVEQLKEMLWMDDMLSRTFGADRADFAAQMRQRMRTLIEEKSEAEFSRAVSKRIRMIDMHDEDRRQNVFRSLRFVGMAAAACLAVAAGIWVFSVAGGRREAGSSEEAVATVISAGAGLRGQVRDGKWMDLRVGDGIPAGMNISADGYSRIALRNGASIEVNGGSALAVAVSAKASDVTLEKGGVFIETSRALTINAGQYDQISVSGTKFEVVKSSGTTVLRVLDGGVRFGRPDSALLISALEASSVSVGGAPSRPEPVRPDEIAAWRARESDGGLVGFWKFDEQDGMKLLDSSGCGNDGVLAGVKRVKGRIGGGLCLDEFQHVDLGNKPSLSIRDHVSISTWIKILEEPGKRTHRTIVGQPRFDPNKSARRNYSIYVQGNTEGKWQLLLSNDSPAGQNIITATDFVLERDKWYHVVGVISIADRGTHRYYVNGKLVKEMRSLGFPSLRPNELPKWLGQVETSFIGLVDEVRIYNRILSVDEISRLANDSPSQQQ